MKENNIIIYYHTSHVTNRKSIVSSGLIAQNKNDLNIKRKPGIYLFDNLKDAKEWAYWDYMTNKIAVDIFEVCCVENIVKDNHREMQEFGAYVTYDNIPPENIRLKSTFKGES